MNILTKLERIAAQCPDKTAVADETRFYTFSSLQHTAACLGAAIHTHQPAGGPVGVLVRRGADTAALFFAAIYGRFHRTGFFVAYFVGLFTFLFAQRVTNAVWANPDSILGRFGLALAKPFGAVTGGVWIGLGVLIAVILTVLSLHWLLRQQVEV